MIDLDGDGRADLVSRVIDCSTWCTMFAAVDLNDDGIDEILVNEGRTHTPVSGLIAVYELRRARLDPVRFPDGSNRFPLQNSYQGYLGAFCSSASTFTTWEGNTDGAGTLHRVSQQSYRLDPVTQTFELVAEQPPTPASKLPPETGWDHLCGASVQIG